VDTTDDSGGEESKSKSEPDLLEALRVVDEADEPRSTSHSQRSPAKATSTRTRRKVGKTGRSPGKGETLRRDASSESNLLRPGQPLRSASPARQTAAELADPLETAMRTLSAVSAQSLDPSLGAALDQLQSALYNARLDVAHNRAASAPIPYARELEEGEEDIFQYGFSGIPVEDSFYLPEEAFHPSSARGRRGGGSGHRPRRSTTLGLHVPVRRSINANDGELQTYALAYGSDGSMSASGELSQSDLRKRSMQPMRNSGSSGLASDMDDRLGRYSSTTPLHSARLSVMVETAYRRVDDEEWERMCQWDYDVQGLKDKSCGQPLFTAGIVLLKRHNLIEQLSLDELEVASFLLKAERAYRDNPYHNAAHAADVALSLNYFMVTGGLKDLLSDIHLFAAFVAALIHDVDHPGVNNAFMTKSNSTVALVHSDQSVLEHHHLHTAFALAREEGSNLFAGLTAESAGVAREMIIQLVLATDFGKHFDFVGRIADRIDSGGGFDLDANSDVTLLLQLAVKCADLSHSAKGQSTHVDWSKRIQAEFFSQGDEERRRELSLSPLVDRDTTNFAKSQAGFIEFFVTPLYRLFSAQCETVGLCVKQAEANLEFWKAMAPEESDSLKEEIRSYEPELPLSCEVTPPGWSDGHRGSGVAQGAAAMGAARRVAMQARLSAARALRDAAETLASAAAAAEREVSVTSHDMTVTPRTRSPSTGSHVTPEQLQRSGSRCADCGQLGHGATQCQDRRPSTSMGVMASPASPAATAEAAARPLCSPLSSRTGSSSELPGQLRRRASLHIGSDGSASPTDESRRANSAFVRLRKNSAPSSTQDEEEGQGHPLPLASPTTQHGQSAGKHRKKKKKR
jgi:hypothetical protein